MEHRPDVTSIPFDASAPMPTPGRGTAASWGRFPRVTQEMRKMPRLSSVLPVDDGDARPLLPYGNGRSYGDTCLNDGGIVIDCRSLDRILDLDLETGIVRAEAGVLLSAIIDVALPQGWFLPVTPGTRFVTLGGNTALRYSSGWASNSSQLGRLTTRAFTPSAVNCSHASAARCSSLPVAIRMTSGFPPGASARM